MKKILIVEDEIAMRTGLRDNLEIEGYEVDEAEDGIQGFEKITNNEYSLILLDVMIPGQSGFDVCKKLRALGNQTPIILLTAEVKCSWRDVPYPHPSKPRGVPPELTYELGHASANNTVSALAFEITIKVVITANKNTLFISPPSRQVYIGVNLI